MGSGYGPVVVAREELMREQLQSVEIAVPGRMTTAFLVLRLYLAETLGLDVDDVHDEADRLEHVLSEELEARIDRALGFPTHDPHGDPIPNAALEWPKSRTG